MNTNVSTIRELRLDFHRVKQKVEMYGEIVITDHGEPAYVLSRLPAKPGKRQRPPDYYARLRKRQPVPIPSEVMRRFWEEERGDR